MERKGEVRLLVFITLVVLTAAIMSFWSIEWAIVYVLSNLTGTGLYFYFKRG